MLRLRTVAARLLFVLPIVLLAVTAGSQPAGAAPNADRHSVFAQPGVLDEKAEGVTVLADYGAFRLYGVADAVWKTVPASVQAKTQPMADAHTIYIGTEPIDTLRPDATLPTNLAAGPLTGPALSLVQFIGPIQQKWLDALQAQGVTPVHYIYSNAYLVWTDVQGRLALDRLAAVGAFVQWAGPFHPAYKLGPSLRQALTKGADVAKQVPLIVQTYDHAGKEATLSFLGQKSLIPVTGNEKVLEYENVRLTAEMSSVAEIAARPDVVWVGEQFPREMNDEVQDQILAGALNGPRTGPTAPGYLAFLQATGLSTSPADYPIVVVTDDGVGTGSPTAGAGDVTLTQLGAGATSRLMFVDNCTTDADGRSQGGHGHINTSIIGGYDTRTGSPFQDENGYQRGMGVSPWGRMGQTKIFTNGGSYSIGACGGTDAGVIEKNFISGGRISSNSWGCSGCASTYDDSSQAYDAGTRDAVAGTAGNQEILFVFSAGNSGSGAATIGTPGNGKNMLTVGASENYRPTWTDGCAVDASGADNAMDVIGFSSRGPAPGGRKKPETIAPGTHIQGTASTGPGYTGSSVCDQYQPAGQTTFAASSGTSHSCPATAGVTSLYHRWLSTHYLSATPSPALMKAYVVAHTTYLTGVSANDTLPSNSQGYGMPNLGMGFDDAVRYLVDQSVIFGNSGETWTFNGSVADPSKPVRIALVYTDAPGAIGTSPQVNNLDLKVVINGATTYLGNVFTGQYSTTGGAADIANNYEGVFLPAGTSGALDITITGFNIAGDGIPGSGDATDQDFALVCYNCAQFPDFTMVVNPASLSVCAPANADYPITIGSILGFNEPATLTTTGLPVGTTTSFSVNPVTPPGASNLTVGTAGVTPGTYPFSLTGTSATKTHSRDLSLTLFDASPGAATLSTPANGATLQPLRPLFTWSAPSQAATYTIEVATDAGFGSIVSTATGLTAATYTPTADLPSNSVLYWRVRSTNSCGTGSDSATFGFATIPLPGDCPMGTSPFTVFFNDFESGDTGWTSSGTGNTWALSTARPHSGLNAEHAVDPATTSDQRLVSPPITLPPGQLPLNLIYYNHQTMEPRTGGCYDGGILEISTDGGTTWTQLEAQHLTDPYNGPVATTNPLTPANAWCGDPQDWTRTVVDLAAFAGQTVNFRWRLGSDPSVGREGWYLDDVKVQSCLSGPDFSLLATPASREVCSPAQAQYNVSLQAYAGFAESVTLSTSGLPGGSSASFSVNPVAPPGSSTMTLTSAGVAPGTYTVGVVGTSTSQTHSQSVTFSVYDAAPAGPVLLTPANGATNVAVRPTFTWNTSPQAVTYGIDIASDAAFNVILQTASGLTSPTFTPTADLPSNSVLFWRVRATNLCGNGTNSTAFSFTTLPLPGDCPIGFAPLPVYFTDFESGDAGWTSGGTGNTWALSTARAWSGTKSEHATDPTAASDQQLVSPAVSLPVGQSPLNLIYYNHQTMESRTGGCFDGGILEISTAGPGGPWTQLEVQILTDPYDGPINGTSNVLNGLNGWCGNPQDWTREVVDLTAYAGQTVNLRWRLGSDSSVGKEGWYLDDVKFQACAPPNSPYLTLQAWRWSDATPPGNNNGILEPGERVALEVDVKNVGNAAAIVPGGVLSLGFGTVTLLNATSPYPDVPPSGVQTNTYRYTFDVSNAHPCGTSVTLHHVVTYAGGPAVVHDMTIPTGTPGFATQTFNYSGPPVSIPDSTPAGVTVPISVPSSGTITDVNVGFGATHTWDGDLAISVRSPAATTVSLSNRHGGSGDNFTGTIFDDEAATPIATGTPPYTGSFRPDAALSAVDGQNMLGTWNLVVSDNAAADTGTVNAWSVVITYAVSSACNPALPGAAPPPVPDTVLGVSKLAADGSSLNVTWDSTTCPATNYNIYYGYGSQLPVSYGGLYGLSGGKLELGTNGGAGYAWSGVPDPTTIGENLLWWVMAGTDGVFTEGSWGRNSGNQERTGPGSGGASNQGSYHTKNATHLTCP